MLACDWLTYLLCLPGLVLQPGVELVAGAGPVHQHHVACPGAGQGLAEPVRERAAAAPELGGK